MVIPDSVTKLGKDSFHGSAIERVTLPAGLKAIPAGMFVNCQNLKSVTLPAGLTAIGWLAFEISGLQSIVIPDSVTKIEESAFEGCTNLTEVTMPRNLTELGSYAFRGCSSLKRIVIPAGVKTIVGGTFKDCTALEEITFEGNVTINDTARSPIYSTMIIIPPFDGCTNIKKLNAGPGVTRIWGLRYISLTDVSGLPLKEQAEIKAYRSAFMQKYGQ